MAELKIAGFEAGQKGDYAAQFLNEPFRRLALSFPGLICLSLGRQPSNALNLLPCWAASEASYVACMSRPLAPTGGILGNFGEISGNYLTRLIVWAQRRWLALNICFSLIKVVPRGGIEPPTRGFSVRCSTN